MGNSHRLLHPAEDMTGTQDALSKVAPGARGGPSWQRKTRMPRSPSSSPCITSRVIWHTTAFFKHHQCSDNTQIYNSRALASEFQIHITNCLLDIFPWMADRLLKFNMNKMEPGRPLPPAPPALGFATMRRTPPFTLTLELY